MTREEHMAWCKKRALEYIDERDISQAIASMLSDLSKHEETESVGLAMGAMGLLEVIHGDLQSARRWIEGFN